MRPVWFGAGLLSVAVGGVGVVIPGLPTTVFFILAASCFSRSSPRLERWVLDLPRIGPMVRDHRAGLGMPVAAKRAAVASIVVAVGLSAWALSGTVLRLGVIVAGLVGVAWILFRIPTRDEGRRAA